MLVIEKYYEHAYSYTHSLHTESVETHMYMYVYGDKVMEILLLCWSSTVCMYSMLHTHIHLLFFGSERQARKTRPKYFGKSP